MTSTQVRAPARRSPEAFGARSSRAWLPLPMFLLGMAFLSGTNPGGPPGFPHLLITVNIAFVSVTSLFVVVLISRSFLLYATPDLLLIGAGALAWGCTGAIAVTANPTNINSTITIYNCGALLSGLLHGAGALLAGRSPRLLPSRSLVLTTSYATILAVFAAIVLATALHLLPAFYIEGKGGTPTRQFVLLSAVVAFTVTGIVLRVRTQDPVSPFTHWYSLGVLLIAAGLFGVLQPSEYGSALNWVSRISQYTGGLYMLAAALFSAREATAWQVSLADALHHTQLRYENLFHLAGDGIVIHRVAADGCLGVILQANPAFCQLLGYTEGELCAAKPGTLECQTAPEPAGGESTPREITLRRSDGQAVVAEVSTRTFSEHGEVLGMSIVRDLSARKATEDQLRELAQRLTWHVENTPLAVIEWGADMRITRWSAGAERLFGWTSSEVLGKRMDDFRWVYREDAGHVHTVSARLQAGNERSFSSNRNYRRDGGIVHCEWYNSSLLDENGNLRSILSLVLDVTSRTQAEAALRRANSELQQFAYAVSHDLQEPLRTIAAFSELLQRRHFAALGAEGARYLNFVASGAWRIENLLVGLRSYLQVDAQPLAAEVTEVGPVLQEVLASLQPLIAREQALIESGDLPRVAVRAIHVHQLLQNLIGNAIKFRGPEAPRIMITAEQLGGMIRFAVADNGIGIDPQYASQIFGVFRRLHGQNQYEGSGIGLAICQKIAERYNGRIWVESAGSGGSTFYFTLPAPGTGNETAAGSF